MRKSLNRAAKGARLERLAKEWLEAQGDRVQLCPNQVVWISPKNGGRRFPVSVAKDFFGCWDGIRVASSMNTALGRRESDRGMFQVTVWSEVAKKRKDLQAAWPDCWTDQDMILAYVPGRNRHFKILRAPEYEWEGECLMPQGKRRVAHGSGSGDDL